MKGKSKKVKEEDVVTAGLIQSKDEVPKNWEYESNSEIKEDEDEIVYILDSLEEINDIEIDELESIENTHLIGEVINCSKLRLRSRPSLKASVMGLFNKGEALNIVQEDSTETFYCVVDEKKGRGFCLKKFVKLN